MAVSREDAQKLIDFYNARERIQQKKELVLRDSTELHLAHVKVGPSLVEFDCSKGDLLGQLEKQMRRFDRLIADLGGEV